MVKPSRTTATERVGAYLAEEAIEAVDAIEGAVDGAKHLSNRCGKCRHAMARHRNIVTKTSGESNQVTRAMCTARLGMDRDNRIHRCGCIVEVV